MTSKLTPILALTATALALSTGCAAAPAPAAPAAPASSTAAPASTVATTAATVKPAKPEPSKGAHAAALDSVIADAKASGKPALLYFGTIWCAPCAAVEKDVMPNAGVQAALAEYRFEKYDAEIGEGIAAAKRFAITSFPTLVFLSPGGDEVDRGNVSTNPGAVSDQLRSRAAFAKVGPLRDADIATTADPQRLITAAQIESQRPESSPDRVRRLYAAAALAARKQKTPEAASLGGDATFAVMQLDARARDRKAHAATLLDFAKQHPESTRAVDAFEGLAALAADAALKPGQLKPLAKRTTDVLEAGHKGPQLRRLAAALKKLGYPEEATRAESVAAREGSAGPAAGSPEALQAAAIGPQFSDPLAARSTMPVFGMKNVPAEVQARSTFVMTSARLIAEECRGLPRPSDELALRIYTKEGAPGRVVLLDPEATPELKACVENGALGLKNLPPGLGEKFELKVVFAPKH
jgi:thiol-disulfide isomerase/thioredoxin